MVSRRGDNGQGNCRQAGYGEDEVVIALYATTLQGDAELTFGFTDGLCSVTINPDVLGNQLSIHDGIDVEFFVGAILSGGRRCSHGFLSDAEAEFGSEAL